MLCLRLLQYLNAERILLVGQYDETTLRPIYAQSLHAKTIEEIDLKAYSTPQKSILRSFHTLVKNKERAPVDALIIDCMHRNEEALHSLASLSASGVIIVLNTYHNESTYQYWKALLKRQEAHALIDCYHTCIILCDISLPQKHYRW